MGKLGTALVASGFFATGIIIGGVTWDGSDSVSNIEGNITQLEEEIQEALGDNEYLQGEFNAMVNKYNDAVEQSNADLEAAEQQRQDLLTQIENLQAEVGEYEENAGNFSEDEEEIQNEITRLESELEAANAEVAELEQISNEAVERSSYEGINREQFSTDGLSMAETWEFTYTQEAVNIYGHDAVNAMQDADRRARVVELVKDHSGVDVTINKISVVGEHLTYEMSTPQSFHDLKFIDLDEGMQAIADEIGTEFSLSNEGSASGRFFIPMTNQ